MDFLQVPSHARRLPGNAKLLYECMNVYICVCLMDLLSHLECIHVIRVWIHYKPDQNHERMSHLQTEHRNYNYLRWIGDFEQGPILNSVALSVRTGKALHFNYVVLSKTRNKTKRVHFLRNKQCGIMFLS